MNLKELRIDSGLKAKKIAKLLGVSRIQLYNYENNKCKMNDKRIKRLARIYKVPCRLIKDITEGTNE